MLIKKGLGGDNEARRAEAALLSIVIDECLLNGMEVAGFAQAFHGGDLRALRINGQHRTGVDGFVVHEHGACAAGAAIADALGAGKLKLVAQSVQQGDARFKLRIQLLAIHIERYRNLTRSLNMRRVIECERADVAHKRDGRGDARDL